MEPTRKVFQSSNFARQFNFISPGTTTFPQQTIDVDQNLIEEQSNTGWDDDNQNEDNQHENEELDVEQQLPEDPAVNTEVADKSDNEDDNLGADANDDENEHTMHYVLGLEATERAFLAESRCDTEKRIQNIVYPRVEIMVSKSDHEFIIEIFAKANLHYSSKIKIASDATDLLCPTNSNDTPQNQARAGVTVQQFALAIDDWSATNGHSNSSTNQLLRIIRDSIPGLNLPLKKKDKVPFSDKDVTSNTIKDYRQFDLKSFPTDICRRECMAFRGTQFIDAFDTFVDCSKLLNCAICGDPRYTKCNREACVKRGSEMTCSPFVPKERRKKGPFQEVFHSQKWRVSMKLTFYRSIIIKLIELYCLSLMEGFEGILDYDSRRVKKDGKIIDILDGVEIKRQQKIMRRRFRKMRKEFRQQAPDLELYSCCLILTAFYDGVVNFKRKADSMWPLMISVASCNPTHRSKTGVGLFLTMLHNISIGTGAEKYMMEEMFTQELIKLENGVIFTIPTQDGFEERHVFLQARLVFAHLDTKALEKFACVKMCNSCNGCALCNMQPGCYRSSMRKYVYGNTRFALHKRHVLRPLGQREFTADPEKGFSAEKMAEMYYTNHKDYAQYFLRDIARAGSIQTTPMAQVNMDEYLPKTELKRKAGSEELYNVWYHTDERFAPHKFLSCCRFAFPDDRDKRKYKRRRNEKYLESGGIARLRRAAQEKKYASGTNRPKTAVDFSCDGVHEICPIVEHTESFKFENFGPDSMHLFANANNNFIKVNKGERGLQNGSREQSYSQGKHVSLQYTQCAADWECNKHDQNFVDAIVNGLFIPANYTNDYRIRNPMKQRGFLRSKDHFNYLIALASFVLSFTDIAPDYVSFLAMYAEDMCKMFDPIFDISGLKLLQKQVFETRSTQEGLFPESEQIFIFHEIVDVVNLILKFGHLRGLMCYSGERANGEISSCITKGGTNYLTTLYSRYILRENISLKYFVSKDDNYYDNSGIYSDFALKLCGESHIIHHFDKADYNNLYKVIFNFLETQGHSDKIMLNSSPFFRLYCAYKYYNNTTTNDFHTWIINFDNSLSRDPNIFRSKNHLFCTEFVFDDEENEVIKDCMKCAFGVVYLSDLSAVAECIIPLKKFQVYSKIIVKGVSFKCRGKDYSVYSPGGSFNSLDSIYSSRKHYSSIARVKAYCIEERTSEDIVVLRTNNRRLRTEDLRNGNKIVTSHTIKFAWLDCAFRMNLKCDPMVHGLALAHCAIRDGVYNDARWQHSVDIDGAIGTDRFVCLNYVDSSPIASSAFNSEMKVILRRGDLSSFTTTSIPNYDCYSTPDNIALAFLYLLPLKPERLSITYDSVLKDSDNTLLVENDCWFAHV